MSEESSFDPGQDSFDVSLLSETAYGFWEVYLPAPAFDGTHRLGACSLDVGKAGVHLLVRSTRESGPNPEQVKAIQHVVNQLAQRIETAAIAVVEHRAKHLQIGSSAKPAAASKHASQGERLTLHAIQISDVAANGEACVGYQFAASWDATWGAGALFHRDRLLRVGHSDVALLSFVARDELHNHGIL